MNSVIEAVVDKGKCMGCGSCHSACPKSLITYAENKEGFIIASVSSSDDCISCGLCLKKCPALQQFSQQTTEFNHVYYGYAENQEIRINATSGGICSALSKDYLNDIEGTVFAARFDLTSGDIKHTEINLEYWKNSMKTFYCQSDQFSSYSYVKKALENEKKVLFIGSPCQVYGLKQYLGGPNNNLLTVDFVCHGVPSRRLFRQYYNKISRKGIVEYDFRSKCNGWPKHMVSICLKNGKKIKRKATLDKYQFLFQEDLSLNSACFSCPFREYHDADITVGDFWTWKKENLKSSEIELGLSIVISNTLKGYSVVQTEKNKGSIRLSEIDLTHRDTVLHKADFDSIKYEKREDFFRYYTANGYEKTILRYASIINAIKLKVKYTLKKSRRNNRC